MNIPTPAVMTVKDFTIWARISRTRAYELIQSGELLSFKVGARRLIRRADAEAWLNAAASPNADCGALLEITL